MHVELGTALARESGFHGRQLFLLLLGERNPLPLLALASGGVGVKEEEKGRVLGAPERVDASGLNGQRRAC